MTTRLRDWRQAGLAAMDAGDVTGLAGGTYDQDGDGDHGQDDVDDLSDARSTATNYLTEADSLAVLEADAAPLNAAVDTATAAAAVTQTDLDAANAAVTAATSSVDALAEDFTNRDAQNVADAEYTVYEEEQDLAALVAAEAAADAALVAADADVAETADVATAEAATAAAQATLDDAQALVTA